MTKITTETFIARAISLHGNKYKYPQPYVDFRTKLEIVCPKHGSFYQTPDHHLRGQGCTDCGRERTIAANTYSLDEFLKKARIAHGYAYDYSCTIYKGSYVPIDITCPKHDIFSQTPNSHLQGKGCPYCGSILVHPSESLEAINPSLANQWHPDLNSDLLPSCVLPYSNQEAWWICDTNINHVWTAVIGSRMSGRGCPFCSGHAVNYTNCLSTLHPLLASEWHPTKNTITPDEVPQGSNKKVWWVCSLNSDHEWDATIASRVYGSGCRFCANHEINHTNCLAKTHPNLVTEWDDRNEKSSAEIHAGEATLYWWKCSKHQSHPSWQASPQNRTRRQSGCPTCTHRVSKSEIEWLDAIGVPERQFRIKVGNAMYEVDGYDPFTNIVYEMLGNFWHGGPGYLGDQINPRTGISYSELYARTIIREQAIKEAGYGYISIWESEWKKLHTERNSSS